MTWQDEPADDLEHELDLTEASPRDPVGLLPRLLQQIRDYLPGLAAAGERYLQARVAQETLKALEIRARIRTQLDTVEIERQRMIAERDERSRAATIAEEHDAAQREARLMELETQRLEAMARAAAALKTLHELGVKVDIEVLTHRLLSSGQRTGHADP
jgi:beta-phosphoglucomutase-like phosphatase (HAD superfamily)